MRDTFVNNFLNMCDVCVYYYGVKVSSALLPGLSFGRTQGAEVLIIVQISHVSITLSLLLIVPLGQLRSSLQKHFVSITSTAQLVLFCRCILPGFQRRLNVLKCVLFVERSILTFVLR